MAVKGVRGASLQEEVVKGTLLREPRGKHAGLEGCPQPSSLWGQAEWPAGWQRVAQVDGASPWGLCSGLGTCFPRAERRQCYAGSERSSGTMARLHSRGQQAPERGSPFIISHTHVLLTEPARKSFIKTELCKW